MHLTMFDFHISGNILWPSADFKLLQAKVFCVSQDQQIIFALRKNLILLVKLAIQLSYFDDALSEWFCFGFHCTRNFMQSKFNQWVNSLVLFLRYYKKLLNTFVKSHTAKEYQMNINFCSLTCHFHSWLVKVLFLLTLIKILI